MDEDEKTDVTEDERTDVTEDESTDVTEDEKTDVTEDERTDAAEGGETGGESVALCELADEVKALSDTVARLVGKIDSVAAAQDVILSNGAIVREDDTEETPDLDAFGMEGVSIDDLDLTL